MPRPDLSIFRSGSVSLDKFYIRSLQPTRSGIRGWQDLLPSPVLMNMTRIATSVSPKAQQWRTDLTAKPEVTRRLDKLKRNPKFTSFLVMDLGAQTGLRPTMASLQIICTRDCGQKADGREFPKTTLLAFLHFMVAVEIEVQREEMTHPEAQ